MCGIVGYYGKRNVPEVVINGLKKLEYRGYDSSGMACVDNNIISLLKSVGKIKNLEEKFNNNPIKGTVGIGHSRWATHGIPSEANAHPHIDCKNKIAVVHNGIIENFMELKNELISKGHKFVSDTDTEVIAHLIEDNYTGDFEDAFKKVNIEAEKFKGYQGTLCDGPAALLAAVKALLDVYRLSEKVYVYTCMAELVKHS